MPTFTTLLRRFGTNGEKTGWTYIEIPTTLTDALKPGQKTSFRVRGMLDEHPLAQVALIPSGQSALTDASFMIPINATMRRAIRKEAGATVRVELEVDDSPMPLSADLMACLDDDPDALAFFQTLPKGHQQYFSKWIEDAKTTETKTKRLTQTVMGLAMGMGYGDMIRYFKKQVE